jgi:hypothetical protein
MTSNTSFGWLKRNGISLSTLIVVSLLITQQAKWQQRIEDAVSANTEHSKSTTVHMPLDQKLNIFVTQNEFKEMKAKLDVINDNVLMLLKNEIGKK